MWVRRSLRSIVFDSKRAGALRLHRSCSFRLTRRASGMTPAWSVHAILNSRKLERARCAVRAPNTIALEDHPCATW